MSRHRLVFFGTPEFAVPSLRALLTGPDEVVGVVCQPDRPAGRGQRLQTPPVKELALAHHIPIAQPEKLRSGDFPSVLAAWAPELAVVAAYGRILPKAFLDLPVRGCINVHASLLPKYRGAAPIQWALLRGEAVTGVTIMQMNERMDEGDILLQRELVIGANETYGELQHRLAVLGADVLAEVLSQGLDALGRQPQDHAAATFAPPIEKEQGRIDWTRPAVDITHMVRAFNPWPSAFTLLDGKLLKIHRAHALPQPSAEPAGTVIAAADVIEIVAGNGRVAIAELQLEGRKRLPARDFVRGHALSIGARLGASG